MAKRFLFIATGILALTAAYHLGAVRTEAQGGGTFSGISVSVQGSTANTIAITTTGDVYGRSGGPQCAGGTMIWNVADCDWQYMGSVVSGPTPAESQSFGSVKDMFRR